MTKMIYHPDTGTFMGLSDCVLVSVPEDVDVEEYLEGDVPFIDLGHALILPMTSCDNAILQMDEVPDLEWRSNPQDRLWIGVEGLSIKIKHEDEGIVIDVYDDLDAEAIASTWAEFGSETE